MLRLKSIHTAMVSFCHMNDNPDNCMNTELHTKIEWILVGQPGGSKNLDVMR